MAENGLGAIVNDQIQPTLENTVFPTHSARKLILNEMPADWCFFFFSFPHGSIMLLEGKNQPCTVDRYSYIFFSSNKDISSSSG